MVVVREDRRVRRTRRMLREALLALVAEKGYDRVTVQDVLDRADLGRATFYAHFRDKDDLLVSGFGELRDALRAAMSRYGGTRATPRTRASRRRALFEHLAAHRQLYRALAGSRAGAIVLRYARDELVALTREHLERVVARRRSAPAVPLEVMAEHTVGALLGVLTWWLDKGTPYSAREMAPPGHRSLGRARPGRAGLARARDRRRPQRAAGEAARGRRPAPRSHRQPGGLTPCPRIRTSPGPCRHPPRARRPRSRRWATVGRRP